MQKELRFKILAWVEMLAAALAAGVAIVAALAHLGVLALVAGQLTGAVARTVALVMVGRRRWRPKLRLRSADLRGYRRFALVQMGERSIDELTDNIDYLLIGRFLGSVALGTIAVAYQLVVLPFQKINPVLTRVAFPAFSLRQTDDAAMRRGYCRLSVTLVFAVFPLLVGLLVTAPVAVPVILGEKWLGAVALVQVLSLMAMIKTLANPMGSLLMAKGRADLGFVITAVQAGVTLVVFLVAVRAGTLAVAWGWVAVSLLGFALWQPIVLGVIGMRLRDYMASLARPLLLGLATGLLLESAYLVLRGSIDSRVVLLIAARSDRCGDPLWALADLRARIRREHLAGRSGPREEALRERTDWRERFRPLKPRAAARAGRGSSSFVETIGWSSHTRSSAGCP